jgi:type IV pilus assembly protein PilW
MIRTRTIKGFTLVELMVGVVIGMIVTIIVFQVLTNTERQKRTTTGTADAQGSGALALAAIGQNARMAGAGLYHNAFGKCTSIYAHLYDGSDIDTVSGATLFQPVTITSTTNKPDKISFLYYNYPASADVRLATMTLTGTSGQFFQVAAVRNCSLGGIALIGQDANCALISVTDGSSTTIQHAPGLGTGYNKYNPNVGTAFSVYTPGNAVIQCFDGLYQVTYQISAGVSAPRALEMVEPTPDQPNWHNPATLPPTTITTTQAPNVVDMRAQYGINQAAAGSPPDIQWVDATGTFATPDLTHIRQIHAVRVALLMRNGEYQKPTSGGPCDATDDTMLGNLSTWAGFNGSRLPTTDDWHCYRYKAFEQAISLRNVLWAVDN